MFNNSITSRARRDHVDESWWLHNPRFNDFLFLSCIDTALNLKVVIDFRVYA